MVSIIVPIYNQEKHLKKCLDSILAQSYSNIEVILVNDGSTDHSLHIAQDYANTDNRIIIINKKNEGVALARRDGLMIANGDFIMFVDSDDYITKNAVSHLHNIIKQENVDVVVGQAKRKVGYASWNYAFFPNSLSNKKVSIPNLWDDYYLSFFGINIIPVSMCGKLYRKDVIQKAQTKNDLFSNDIVHIGEDEYFNLLLHPYVESMFFSSEPIYVYRFGGITTHYNPYLQELLDFSDFRLNLLDLYQYSKGYGPLFNEYTNYIISEIIQRIEYLQEEEKEIVQFLESEFHKRKIFKRMISYYKEKTCHENTQLFLEKDFHGIYILAKNKLNRNKNRRLLKKIASHLYRIM